MPAAKNLAGTSPVLEVKGVRDLKFRSVVELGGKTATGISVPAEVVAGLGSTKRPAVTVHLNGHTYRSTIAPMGGTFMLPLSAENRLAAGLTAGDEVEVEVELDTEIREVTEPADFARALNADADARRLFDSLSYSNKRRLVLAIDGAKTAETRQRRIEKTVVNLHDGRT